MVKVGLLLRCEANPDKVAEVEQLFRDGLEMVDAEPETKVWFGLRLGPSSFGIFDAFPDDDGRQTHLAGRLGSALMARSAELFTKPPEIDRVDVFVSKLPIVCLSQKPRFEDAVPEAVPQDAVPVV
jgi:quinol monooxygenase YgiN